MQQHWASPADNRSLFPLSIVLKMLFKHGVDKYSQTSVEMLYKTNISCVFVHLRHQHSAAERLLENSCIDYFLKDDIIVGFKQWILGKITTTPLKIMDQNKSSNNWFAR